MHLDAETLERALHGELDGVSGAETQEHLSICPECNAALEASRLRERRLFGLLEALDHEAPELDWEGVEVRSTRRGARLLVAASIAFALGAGILYALPDSPLRNWIDRVGRDVPAQEAEVEAAGPGSVSGLSIRPTSPFEIVFTGPQESGVARVDLVESSEVEIRVLGPPVDLESGPDRVTVANRGSRSSYAIRLPVAGPAITVRVGNAVVLVRSEGQLRTAAPRAGTGEYRIDLARPGR